MDEDQKKCKCTDECTCGCDDVSCGCCEKKIAGEEGSADPEAEETMPAGEEVL